MRIVIPFVLAFAATEGVLFLTEPGRRFRQRRLYRKADHASAKGRTLLAEKYLAQAAELDPEEPRT
jgi:hypothetical protein